MRRLICISVFDSMDSNIEQRSFLDFLRENPVRMADSMPVNGQAGDGKTGLSCLFYSYKPRLANLTLKIPGILRIRVCRLYSKVRRGEACLALCSCHSSTLILIVAASA
jgi:hypothetical protein